MAGRPKGSSTRKHLTVGELCKKLKFDPVNELITLKDQLFTRIDKDGNQVEIGCSPELKAKIMVDLLPYIHPKLSTVEVKGEIDITKPLVILNGLIQT
jgi:hypothetical protein